MTSAIFISTPDHFIHPPPRLFILNAYPAFFDLVSIVTFRLNILTLFPILFSLRDNPLSLSFFFCYFNLISSDPFIPVYSTHAYREGNKPLYGQYFNIYIKHLISKVTLNYQDTA